MDEKRDKTQYPSGEPGSPYSDAYYEKAPESKRSCYGYNVAQCYARASGEPEPPEMKKKPQGAGIMILGLAVLFCVLAIALFSAGGVLLSDNASAAEESSREIYEDYSASHEESGDLAVVNTAGPEARELTAEEIYNVACRCTVGVTVPGYAYNVFGQAGDSVVMGSGIVLSEDGYILTNYHVIENAYESGANIMVIDFDGASYPAETVGIEADSDLAVLKIEAEGLVPVVLGSSDDLHVGDSVVAIGNPLGELTFSLTSGVVSALAREITMSNGTKMTLIQTDCAINSGNSGGALFNLYGEVIGITNAKYSGSSSGTEASIDNIGFAIPMNTVWHIVSGIIENGYYAKPYLGVTVQDYVSDSKRGPEAGAELVTVVTGGPADSAGLQAGDVIVEANGAAIDSSEALVRFVSSCDAGGTAVFTLWRSGQTLTVTLTLGEKPQPQEALQIPRVNG